MGNRYNVYADDENGVLLDPQPYLVASSDVVDMHLCVLGANNQAILDKEGEGEGIYAQG